MKRCLARLHSMGWSLLWMACGASLVSAAQQEGPCDDDRWAATAFLVGTWTVEAIEPGAGTRRGWSTVSRIAGGCALQEHLRLEYAYEEVRVVAFDERAERWQISIVDSDHGNVLLLEGHETGNGLEFITTHQRRSSLLVDRVSITDTESGWIYRVEAAPGYGEDWATLLELRYTPLRADGDGPAARAHHQLVYHAGEERAYLIGGSTREGDGYRYFRDVWRREGDRWVPHPELPFPRSSHGAVYHAGRDDLLLFGGGFQSAVAAEGVLWARDSDGWQALAGRADAGRDEPGMCYDEERDTVVLFGGWGPDRDYRDETWAWSGDGLILADTLGPAPRAGHVLVFDPVLRRCLLHGGRGEDGYLDDTWTWDGTRWREEEIPGPGARWFAGAAMDAGLDRIVLFGGRGPEGDLADTWSWTGRGWERLDLRGDGPEPRSMAGLAFTTDGVILFGGRTSTVGGFHDHHDTWILRGDRWQEVGPGR